MSNVDLLTLKCLHNRLRLGPEYQGRECSFGGGQGEPCPGMCPNWKTADAETVERYGGSAVVDYYDLLRDRGLGLRDHLDVEAAPRSANSAANAAKRGQTDLGGWG